MPSCFFANLRMLNVLQKLKYAQLLHQNIYDPHSEEKGYHFSLIFSNVKGNITRLRDQLMLT